MAEFLTMEDAESKFGKKGKTNAGLTLGIIGTALAALNNGGSGCGCGNGGILGGLFGGNNGGCAMEQAEQAKTLAMAQGQAADNLAWANRVQSLEDDFDMYSYFNTRDLSTNTRIGNEVQILTNQIWEDRVKDLKDKGSMYVDILTRDNVRNVETAKAFADIREKDVEEKASIFERLSARINDLEKKEVATQTALPLMFELAKVNAERYSDNNSCKNEKAILATANALQVEEMLTANNLQRQLDTKISGQLKYAYSDLCAPVPSISPLYCSPFTQYGTGMYAGAAAANYNAVNNAFAGACPSCQVQ